MNQQFKPDSEDLLNATALIKDIPQNVSTITSMVKRLTGRVQNGEFNTTKGISFLNVKSHMLLNYLINLTYLILKKTTGKPIQNDPAIERLVELRTVLEKMRPIDQKLKYQIQKLITTANTGHINVDDPLTFKANPENLLNEDLDESEDDSSEKDTKKSSKSKIYVPPKIAPTFYDGDDTVQARREKLLERIKKRALNSSILEELKLEHDTGPEEIKEVNDELRRKIKEDFKERQQYEEEYMLRLPLTKKQRHEAKQVTTVSSLHNLAKFDDISALEFQPSDLPCKKTKSSKRNSFKKSKRKSFKKKKY